MYSKSANTSRNQRSKGFKLKHILQICVLVTVCFWLIYQVKHSHEKKSEFDENDSNSVSETHNDGNIPKLGRKDISRVRETITDDKLLQGEDGEENEADEEENKHVEGEQEREEESRTDNREEEDTGRGGGDDEIDKNEEKIDDENHEEILDEEKLREEGDEKIDDDDDSRKEEIEMVLEDQDQGTEARNTHKEDNEESDTVLEDQDQDQGHDTHEAREELYKADDASSEVAHDTKTIFPGTENATLKTELVSDGKENASQSSSDFSSKNSTTLKEFNDQSQTSNNATYEDGNNKGSNKTMSLISSANVSDSTDTNDHVNTTSSGSLNITVAGETKVDNVNATKTSTDKDMDSDSENVTAEENESSISNTENENENVGADLHDPVDDLDSSLTQEEKEYRTDLGTLPDIKLEVENGDDVEAE